MKFLALVALYTLSFSTFANDERHYKGQYFECEFSIELICDEKAPTLSASNKGWLETMEEFTMRSKAAAYRNTRCLTIEDLKCNEKLKNTLISDLQSGNVSTETFVSIINGKMIKDDIPYKERKYFTAHAGWLCFNMGEEKTEEERRECREREKQKAKEDYYSLNNFLKH